MRFLDRKQHWYSGELSAVINLVKALKETQLIKPQDIVINNN